jgi:hypothetical protein
MRAMQLAQNIGGTARSSAGPKVKPRFDWSQHVASGQGLRWTRNERQVDKPLWSRIAPARQLAAEFRLAVGRQLRRS